MWNSLELYHWTGILFILIIIAHLRIKDYKYKNIVIASSYAYPLGIMTYDVIKFGMLYEVIMCIFLFAILIAGSIGEIRSK